MSEADEEIFYDCVVCSGDMKRGRNGVNGTRCKHESCKKELTRRNRERRAAAALVGRRAMLPLWLIAT